MRNKDRQNETYYYSISGKSKEVEVPEQNLLLYFNIEKLSGASY
jgi:hypothetical protein